MNKNAQKEHSTIKIDLNDMRVSVRIGLHEKEKQAHQDILISISLYLELGDYLNDPKPNTILDYDVLYNKISRWSERPHTLLIESYLKELIDLCFEDPRVEKCEVSIKKPDIFENVQNVGVCACISREDWD